jgi:tRNA1Val (adenine37-N6)-methyltransferase
VSNTYFEFKQFKIYQDKSAFKVTTDACILGAYADTSNPDSICDIGTGTGVLALMLAQKFPGARIDAVEIDNLSALQAKENARSSPWAKRISVFNGSIQDFSISNKRKYNLIVCNPPYYEDYLKSKDYRNNLTKHNFKISIKELAVSINDLLMDNGLFYTIMPPFSFNKLKAELEVYDIGLFDRLDIYSKLNKPLYRKIGGFSRGTGCMTKNTIFISNENGDYSKNLKKLLKDYYLAF